jgi:hypothetical protein
LPEEGLEGIIFSSLAFLSVEFLLGAYLLIFLLAKSLASSEIGEFGEYPLPFILF